MLVRVSLVALLSIANIGNALAESDVVSSICQPPITDVLANGGVSNMGGSLRFSIGSKEIVTCEGNGFVNIVNMTDGNATKYRCVHMKNEVDGGKGFAPENYDTAHLWLYVSEEEDPDLVQIGIYEGGTETKWIITDYFCG